MRAGLVAAVVIFLSALAGIAEAAIPSVGQGKLNNLVSELLAVSSVSQSKQPLTFVRSADGWIFISATGKGTGTVRVVLDQKTRRDLVIGQEGAGVGEAMRYVSKGEHTIQVEREGNISVESSP